MRPVTRATWRETCDGRGRPDEEILVALDGSPRAEGVLRYAESLARSTSAKLILLRAFGIPPDMALAWPASDEPLEAALQKQTQAYLDERARTVPSELLAQVRVGNGTPWETVCAVAREANVTS